MIKTLDDETVVASLNLYFPNPQVTGVTVLKRGAENTTALLEGNFGKVVLRIWGEEHSRMGARKLYADL